VVNLTKYRVTEQERSLILELLDRNFSVRDVSRITGVHEGTIYALRRGFKSLAEYQEDLAKKKGFKSRAEYQEHTKIPISLIVGILYEQGEATLEEVTQNVRKILGVNVKEATIERKIKGFNFQEPWFTITNDQNKRIKIDREHFFVKSMLQGLFEEK
jgi:IS30 family transposase